MVTVSAVKFADATADGSVPASLKSVNVLGEGKFTPNFAPGAVTQEFDEFKQLPYRGYRATGSYQFDIELPMATLENWADLTGSDIDEAKKKITMGTSAVIPKAQYFEVYGANNAGVPLKLTAYCCDVVTKWNGSVGAAQATVPVSVNASLRLDYGNPSKMMTYEVLS